MVKDLNNNKRFKKIMISDEPYYFDKYIFRSVVLLMILLFCFVLYENQWNWKYNIYVSCPKNSMTYCENPFYNITSLPSDYFSGLKKDNVLVPYEIYSQEVFYPGFEFGNKPKWFASHYDSMIWIIILLGFVVNHLVNNKHINSKSLYKDVKDAFKEVDNKEDDKELKK